MISKISNYVIKDINDEMIVQNLCQLEHINTVIN